MKHFFLLGIFLISVNISMAQTWTNVGSNFNITAPDDIFADSLNNLLYVCGDNIVARWDGFNWTYSDTTGYYTRCVAAYNGSLYAGGDFYQVADGTIVKYISKWDGNNWLNVGGGLWPGGSQAYDMEVFNNELYVCGRFNTAGGVNSKCIAKWNGNNWFYVEGGISGYLPYVNEIVKLFIYNGELYDIFYCNQVGQERSIICKYNGVTWNEVANTLGNFGLAGGSTLNLTQICFFGGELHAIGTLYNASNSSYGGYIGKWNGSSWTSLPNSPAGIGNYLEDLITLNNKLYVTGDFMNAGSLTVNDIAYWDGLNWDGMDNGLVGTVSYSYALGNLNDDLYVGGKFTQAGTILATNIAKWSEVPTTITENNKKSVFNILAPNPSKDIFTVTDTKVNFIEIYDLFGHKIFSIKIENYNKQINISSAPSGVYYYRAFSGEGIYCTGKIILE